MNTKELTPKMIREEVWKKLKRYEKMNLFEQYAMFMGKVQLIELVLKNILVEKYKYPNKDLERLTLGGAIAKLEEEGLRKDYLSLLRYLNKFRIELAHNLLADDLIGKSLIGLEYERFSWKTLRHAVFAVEHTITVHDFLTENNYLYNGKSPNLKIRKLKK